MKSFACYCQKCRTANLSGEEACSNCGTPLMLVVTPSSIRNEMIWSDLSTQEHLLERISILELRLAQVTDRLKKALDLMIRQTKTVQKDHLLVETLMDSLAASGIIESGKLSQTWQEKKKNLAEREVFENRLEQIRDRILASSSNSTADSFAHLVNDGFRLLSLGDEKQGLKTLERAVAGKSANPLLLAFIGEHYYRTDKRVAARDFLEKAHRTMPTEMRISLLLGIVLADEGELEAAKILLEPFSETESFAANFVLGMIYATEKRLEKTLAAFKCSLSALPSAETHYLVGSVYAELGREKTALRHFQKAVELNPNFADGWFMLGAVYLRLGDETEAKKALSQSLTISDLTAQSQAILRNPQKFAEIAGTTLIFARLDQAKKNLISGCSPRLVKLLREDIAVSASAKHADNAESGKN